MGWSRRCGSQQHRRAGFPERDLSRGPGYRVQRPELQVIALRIIRNSEKSEEMWGSEDGFSCKGREDVESFSATGLTRLKDLPRRKS